MYEMTCTGSAHSGVSAESQWTDTGYPYQQENRIFFPFKHINNRMTKYFNFSLNI
jgi:hypothetical protein